MSEGANNLHPSGKTLVVGIGEVGGALAEVLERSQAVLRHDLARVEFDSPIGVMHLCIPFTSRGQFEDAALSYIARFRPELTIVNSTVIPGTTRRLAEKSRTRVAFSPVRGKHAHMTRDLFHYTKFVAAADPDTANTAVRHFTAAGLNTRTMSKPEALELAKLAETTYFGVLIAFAQDLNRYARQLEVDYSEATRFFDEVNFLPRVRYYPGFIGGHCVIPNIMLLKQIRDSGLLDAILASNRERAQETDTESTDSSSPATADANASGNNDA